MKNYIFIETPLGKMTLAEENDYITNIAYGEITLEASCENETELLSQAKQQLAEYFNGERKEFNLPLKPSGTVFQLSVWKALTEIPYGFSLSSVISSQPETVLWSVRAIPESPYSLAVCISDSTVNLPSLCRV